MGAVYFDSFDSFEFCRCEMHMRGTNDDRSDIKILVPHSWCCEFSSSRLQIGLDCANFHVSTFRVFARL